MEHGLREAAGTHCAQWVPAAPPAARLLRDVSLRVTLIPYREARVPVDIHLHNEHGLVFTATTKAGFTLKLDSTTADHTAAAPSPMELQLMALGGCTGMDVISVLRKMRQDVTAYDVTLSGERAAEHPRLYTSIVMTHRVRGRDLAESSIRRAVGLSMDRYCPVFNMLYPRVSIREQYEILDDATGTTHQGDVPYGSTSDAG